MCCSKLNYNNDDVIILLVMMLMAMRVMLQMSDEGNDDVFHGECNDNAGYDIFFYIFLMYFPYAHSLLPPNS